MKKLTTFSATLLLTLLVLFIAFVYAGNSGHGVGPKKSLSALVKNDEFLPHRSEIPPKSEYDGPLFKLSHAYPESVVPVINPSWDQALKKHPLSESNVFAYMDALKRFIEPNLLPFFTDNKNWDAAQHHWFHEPWVGIEREAILGSYQGNGNPAHMFKSLNVDEAGYVVTLYDPTAAYTVGKIWGQSGQKPDLLNNAAQFKEGSVIVKLAFSNINYPEWSVMKGAQTFKIYDTIATAAVPNEPKKLYKVRKVSFFQMDVIVKDSKASPKTGWVYSTFVYDKDANGTFWDKMVPLGAMWGNDPEIVSPVRPPYPKLNETVINEKAPYYSRETLGWGGRLSGPNDGAVGLDVADTNGTTYKKLAFSSCMSCHSPAQHEFLSFLLPAASPVSKFFAPGSPQWRLWFENRSGDVPFDKGQVALDYDMVMALKSFADYSKLTAPAANQLFLRRVEAVKKFRRHNTTSQFWH